MRAVLKCCYLNFLLLLKAHLSEALPDTSLLLVIESSVHNQDFDVLCSLRDVLLTLQNETQSSTTMKFIKYIELLLVSNHVHHCGSDYIPGSFDFNSPVTYDYTLHLVTYIIYIINGNDFSYFAI